MKEKIECPFCNEQIVMQIYIRNKRNILIEKPVIKQIEERFLAFIQEIRPDIEKIDLGKYRIDECCDPLDRSGVCQLTVEFFKKEPHKQS